ncbi:sugar ABC transporter permease [Peptostreptococcaceae bacterium AGR-M142]
MDKDKKILLYMLIPGILGFFIFYLIPFLMSIPSVFLDSTNSYNFVGLKNIRDILSNIPFLRAIKNTSYFLLISMPLIIIVPLLLALSIYDMDKRSRNVYLVLFLIPMAIPSGSLVFFFKQFFSLNGFLNNFLSVFHTIKIDWFNSSYSLIAIIIIYLWKNIGYNVVLFMGGLLMIPKEYKEYAFLEGASKLDEFRYITIIYLIPTLLLVFLMSVINSFKIFREIYLIFGSYPSQNTYMIQHFLNNTFTSLNYEKLVSASNIVTVLIGSFVFMFFYFENKLLEKIYDFRRGKNVFIKKNKN